MKHLCRRLLFICCIFILIGCFTEKPANYYRKIRLDGNYSIVGRFPIAAVDAKRVNCYRLEYNEQGKIVKVEYFENGKIARDTYFGIEKMTIDYSDGLEKRTYLNRKDQLSENKNGVFYKRT